MHRIPFIFGHGLCASVTRVLSSARQHNDQEVRLQWQRSSGSRRAICEGNGDVVGVVIPLVRGGAQFLHGDQVVELSVLLEVHEREEKGEDGEGQIEVESERGELKERRTCTWMT